MFPELRIVERRRGKGIFTPAGWVAVGFLACLLVFASVVISEGACPQNWTAGCTSLSYLLVNGKYYWFSFNNDLATARALTSG